MSKKVTIYDIARYLHITPAAVSYSLNNVSKVSEETRKKVLQVAKELGYSIMALFYLLKIHSFKY